MQYIVWLKNVDSLEYVVAFKVYKLVILVRLVKYFVNLKILLKLK